MWVHVGFQVCERVVVSPCIRVCVCVCARACIYAHTIFLTGINTHLRVSIRAVYASTFRRFAKTSVVTQRMWDAAGSQHGEWRGWNRACCQGQWAPQAHSRDRMHSCKYWKHGGPSERETQRRWWGHTRACASLSRDGGHAPRAGTTYVELSCHRSVHATAISAVIRTDVRVSENLSTFYLLLSLPICLSLSLPLPSPAVSLALVKLIACIHVCVYVCECMCLCTHISGHIRTGARSRINLYSYKMPHIHSARAKSFNSKLVNKDMCALLQRSEC